jgi:hypothetical protein
MDRSAQVMLAIMVPSLMLTAAIVVTVLWMSFQARLRSIDVLKAYAERGEEPPAQVLDAVERINRPGAPLKPPTRGDHLTHLAGSVVLAVGLAGVAWWLAPSPAGGWGRLFVILAVLGAVFFAGSAAARLTAALVTRD